MPTVPFMHGYNIPSIPLTERDLSFAWGKISKGLEEHVIEEIKEEYALKCFAEGEKVSAAFVAWSGEGEEEKYRFMQNLHDMNHHCEKGSAKLGSIPAFTVEAERKDFLMSFDIEAGYHHFYI